MVVDGEWEFVGSDSRALDPRCGTSRQAAKVELKLALKGRQLSIATPAAPAGAELILAITPERRGVEA